MDQLIITTIRKQFPELDIECIDGWWCWTFRCQESTEYANGYCESALEALIHFAKTQSDAIDSHFEEE